MEGGEKLKSAGRRLKAGGSQDWLPHWCFSGHSAIFFLGRLSKMPSVERHYCDGVEKKEART